jgi:glutathione synthase
MHLRFIGAKSTTTRTFTTTPSVGSPTKSLYLHLLFLVLLSLLPSASSLAQPSVSTTTTTTPATTSTSTTTMNTDAVNLPVDQLAIHANSYASAHGIQVERRHDSNHPDPKKAGGSYFECAPMSLLPNAYPQQAFQLAQSVAPSFNELVEKISQDADFLQQTLGGGVSDADPFTAKLLQLYREIYVNDDENDNNNNKFAKLADRLGIHRSDYMLHKPSSSDDADYQLKQVELNTIAASFAGLSVNMANLHRHLTSRFATDVNAFLKANQKIVLPNRNTEKEEEDAAPGVPVNPALERLPNAMNLAHERYLERFGNGNAKNKVILFVVQEGETNTVDQRMLEFRLWDTHGIPVVRMSLSRAATEVIVDPVSGALLLPSNGKNQEVSVVYYRAGYAPTDYPDGYDGIEWKARAMLERSRATKAPSLGYHLAGTKKVQQELARPGVVERFFPTTNSEENANKVKVMRSVFAGLYSLGEDATEEDLAAVQNVLFHAQQGQYVLKPQREGGGYNFYGDKMAAKLKENTIVVDGGEEKNSIQLGKVLAEYILMQRLFPPQQRVVLMRNGNVEGSGDAVSELGCFGTLVVTHDGVICHNEYSGFLLRTKFANVDEGGVASGFATLSSPYLC